MQEQCDVLAAPGAAMMGNQEVMQESLFLPTSDGSAQLHVRHIYAANPGPAVLMVHGAIANARTFYSEKGKGLGPWLAARGFDVYIMDLRGRGASLPKLARGARHGQTETIVDDIPLVLGDIARRRGDDVAVHCVGHSWGGVLISSTLARHPAWAKRVASCAYLATKRRIGVWNLRRIGTIELFWSSLASAMCLVFGYLPALRFGIGADDESVKSLRQSQLWVRSRRWRDSDDGFDYAAALANGGLPPTLYLAGSKDPVLGHPEDVARFIQESGPHRHHLQLLGTVAGLSREYGHVDMLTHAAAESEVYPFVEAWLSNA
ncbi:MAG: alpha/beta fold hydrolase [Burkholderiales bacterium]|nr:alpha/beta fold hydrolase [Burkholderiales bacterium]